MMNSVAISGLRVVRGGREVLHHLSFAVPRGSVTGLLGPSGSGKTTLLRAIVGAQRIAGGAVTVLGEPAGSPVLRRRVGYDTQRPAVYTDLTVEENLRYFAAVLRAPATDVDRVLADVDLAGERRALAGRLSGGQLSRVGIAVALLGEPELLVLDEPTVGLDPLLRADLWGLFRRLASGGVTLLVSSHVMDEASHCERLLLLRDGTLFADRTPEDLLAATGAPDMEAAFVALITEREQLGSDAT